MKALFQETFELLGAQVADLSPHELHVKVPGHSAASSLLEAPSDHILSFSSKNANPAGIIVTPGSILLENATQKLAQIGAMRHGILPIRYPNSGKTFPNKCAVFGGAERKFSCRRGWQNLVRIWLKITLFSDEVVEMLTGIEIPADMQPRLIETETSAGQDVQWVAKPRLKLKQLEAFIEAGIGLAEDLTVVKAEDLQRKNFETLYPTIERLRIYYQHLTEDSAGTDPDRTSAIKAEYRRRIREEIQYARTKATLDLIAVETLATPVQNLTWLLEQNGMVKEATAVLNLYDGTFAAPIRYDISGCEACTFAGTASNESVCKCMYS